MNVPFVKRLCSISRASCIALVLSLSAPGLLYAASTTQIFILHSYSQEYAWTQGQHEGFIQTIEADAQADPLVSTEYLDTKRRPYDKTYVDELARHLRSKYAGYKPSAIYVTDDNALLFARDHLSRIFPGVPVFFSGVNDYGVRSSLDQSIFTGVFERKEVGPNIEWLLHLDKDANDLIFVGDDSNTYQAIESELRSELIPYRLRTTFIAEKRLDRALALLHDLPGKYLFLTTLGGMTDANDQVLPLRDIMKSLSHTGRIVISMEDAYILEGVLGGYVTSGQHQGMSAARLFLAYLHGKPIADLPPILKSPNALIFDDRVLHQYDINLPKSLSARAVLLNRRLGIYEQHRLPILGSLMGLAAILFLVVTGSLVIMSRKNRELNLARSNAESANALFNQLAEQSRTVHWEVNAKGLYTYVNPVSYTVLGYRSEELVDKKHFYDLRPVEEQDNNKPSALKFFARKEPLHDLENTVWTKDGRLICVLTSGFPVLDDHGTFLGYRGSDSDITERKQIEKALQESEERYRTLIENASDIIFKTDDTGHFTFVNPAGLRIAGYEEKEVIGTQYATFIQPDRREAATKFFGRQFMRRLQNTYYEYPFITKDGREIWLGQNTSLLVEDGHVSGFQAIAREITERKRVEKALSESEKHLKLVTDNVPALIGYVDKNYRYQFVNKNYERWFGLKQEAMLGKHIKDLLPKGTYEISLPFVNRALSGEEVTFEGTVQLPDGTTKVFYNHLVPDRSSNHEIKGYYVLVSDITEHKREEEEKRNLEERLQRAEKMEALGQLAGGVAHDLNNVLGILSGYSELLLLEIPEGSRSRGHAEKILQSTEKGAAIIQDLLTLARRGVTVSEVLNLNSVVSGFQKTPVFEKMKDYHPRVTFRTECDRNLLNIKGSPVHLEKTLMNLMSNAGESISGKGEVLIRTENRYLDRPIRGYDEVKEGDYAVLTVSDTGIGIPAENREKIFEPFYTKKTMGRSGTGLGLAIVWGTVKDHSGYIDVQSEVGQGTTFTLYFPVTREDVISKQQKMPMERYMGKGESVLVVDDIAGQRGVAARLLTQMGYKVHVVSSGEEAVDYLKGKKADILVLDMIMPPGIDGLETYARVLEINPNQKAIIVSGFSETERVKKAQRLGAGAYVKKPYIMEKIGVAIRDELDRK